MDIGIGELVAGAAALTVVGALLVWDRPRDWRKPGRRAANSPWALFTPDHGPSNDTEERSVFSAEEIAQLNASFARIIAVHARNTLSPIRRTVRRLSRWHVQVERAHIADAARGHVILFFADGTIVETAGVPSHAQRWIADHGPITPLSGPTPTDGRLTLASGSDVVVIPATAIRVDHVTHRR